MCAFLPALLPVSEAQIKADVVAIVWLFAWLFARLFAKVVTLPVDVVHAGRLCAWRLRNRVVDPQAHDGQQE